MATVGPKDIYSVITVIAKKKKRTTFSNESFHDVSCRIFGQKDDYNKSIGMIWVYEDYESAYVQPSYVYVLIYVKRN